MVRALWTRRKTRGRQDHLLPDRLRQVHRQLAGREHADLSVFLAPEQVGRREHEGHLFPERHVHRVQAAPAFVRQRSLDHPSHDDLAAGGLARLEVHVEWILEANSGAFPERIVGRNAPLDPKRALPIQTGEIEQEHSLES